MCKTLISFFFLGHMSASEMRYRLNGVKIYHEAVTDTFFVLIFEPS